MHLGIFSRKGLGGSIERGRVAAGLTLDELAEASGLTVARLLALTLNEDEPTDEEYVLLQRVLGEALKRASTEVGSPPDEPFSLSAGEAALQPGHSSPGQERPDSADIPPECGGTVGSGK
jgi:transcriptional regulator with XRE-family HTH domain